MTILYLAHRVPYPPNKGDKIRSYHHVRHLARSHEVHLCSFFERVEEAREAGPVREFCHGVTLVPLRPWTAFLRGAAALAARRSFSEGYFGSGAMRRAVARVSRSRRFDVAWAFSSVMAQFFGAARACRRVVDLVDVDSEKWRQFAARAQPPMSWAYRIEANRLRACEGGLGTEADALLFVSETEAAAYRTFGRNRDVVRVIPNGVDTEYFRPSGRRRQESPTLLFTGALDYRPNVEAVLFVAREVLPRVRERVPDARFLAVGHRPPARLLREIRRGGEGVEVAGSVPDVRPYFERASVFVAPMRLGRGVQNKLLEAMAMRVPVVATPLALEGIDARPGEHLMAAETAEQFADRVVLLLRDPAQRARLAEAAARLIEERYGWAPQLRLLDAVLGAGEDDGRGVQGGA